MLLIFCFVKETKLSIYCDRLYMDDNGTAIEQLAFFEFNFQGRLFEISPYRLDLFASLASQSLVVFDNFDASILALLTKMFERHFNIHF